MLKKGQKAIDYIRAIEIIRVKHVELMTASLQHIEAQSDLDELKKRNEEIEQLLQEKRAEVAKADKDVKHYVERYKAVAASFLNSTEEEPALMEFYEAMSAEERARTPEDLELEIGARQARLELLHEGDPTIIRAFEDRARQITRLAEKVAGNDEGLQALEQEVVQIRTQWEPKLDALVAKISDAFGASFSKINCAGEVSVYKPGEDGRDFENWSILIQVKFRENEQLSALDNHRQSGGERAVSTIFYLMALQTLSRAPFRVVDEINQGMDPRNERIVHERMVDIACGKASVQRPEEDGEGLAVANGDNAGGQISQYFLITPKLLTGLKYAPGMTVHCIASGEYMPDAKEGISFAGYLQKRQRFLQQRSGLASVAA
jgi:chromosome segregation ATPase